MKGLLSAAPSAVPVATSTPCVVVGAQSFGFDKAAGDSPFELTWETAQHAVSHRPVPTGNLVRGLYIEDLASAW